MKNILTFEDYRKMNIRQVESVIYRQFIEENIKEEVNEGIIRKAINKAAGNFIQTALADEIEKGKELEKSIKEALDGLDKGFEEIKKKIDVNPDSKSKFTAIEKVKEAIKAVQSQAFDTLTMIGSAGEIDFAGFLGSATVATAINFGVILTPIRSMFIARKAYKYFIGIIKQTIRRNLLIIQLNFDQFENLILQKSFETDNDSETATMSETLNAIILSMQRELIGKDSKLKFTGKKGEEMRKYLANFKETQNALIKQHKEDTRNNPLSSLWQDQHNNTYTRTLEQIKQYINEDSQKELDALKNSITKLGTNDVDLTLYGELLISAAEEYAIHTNHGINNNFIKMSSVFNLENQKKLIELIVATQKENEEEAKKKKADLDFKEKEKEIEEDIKEGKKLYEEKLKDSTVTYTIDTFDKEFSNREIEQLSRFFTTEDGKKAYEELVEKNPIYKYLLTNDILSLDNFLRSINNLKVIEVSEMKDFYDNIVNKDQTLYYMMAEKSIKDAVKTLKSEDYFSFENINESDVEENILTNDDKKKDLLNSIIGHKNIKPKKGSKMRVPKTKYFLTFNGNGESLFKILHDDFKTNLFNEDKTGYASEISTESKQDIVKIIHKYFKLGNSLTTQLGEYLSRLEAHMLLEEKKPWFVAQNNTVLFEECFKPDSDKILNKNAFVEINPDDYTDIKNFLTKYHSLSDNDFNITSDKNEKSSDDE
jgi:hypothetical protein